MLRGHRGQRNVPRAPPADPATIHYLSTFPPSPSGVALYASMFKLVLARLGSVRPMTSPATPSSSQRMSNAMRGGWAGLRLRGSEADLVHVELSGRALYEFYFCAALACRTHRPALVVTCHDAPSVAGAVFLFSAMDRRGLRRVGVALSRTAGGVVERCVMRRADAVVALTAAGASALASRYGRGVVTIPHVATAQASATRKRKVVFVPGYVSRPELVVDVVEAVLAQPHDEVPSWRVVIGDCDAATHTAIYGALSVAARRQTTFTGALTEAELLETFETAAVVVRVVGARADNCYAASGPLTYAASRGCVVITDDRRAGARELADEGLIEITEDVVDAVRELMARWPEPTTPDGLRRRFQARAGVDEVARLYRLRVLGRQSAPAATPSMVAR